MGESKGTLTGGVKVALLAGVTRTAWLRFVPRQLVMRGLVSVGGVVLFVVVILTTRNPVMLAAAVAIAALGNALPSAPIDYTPPAELPRRPALSPDAAVAVEATTAYLAGSRWRAFAANIVSNAGLWGGIALLVAWAGDLSPTRRAAVVTAFALPAAVTLWASIAAIAAIVRGNATEFEAHLLTRSAALALGGLALLSIGYGVAELVISAPHLSAWWVLAAAVTVWSASFQLLRRRMAG